MIHTLYHIILFLASPTRIFSNNHAATNEHYIVPATPHISWRLCKLQRRSVRPRKAAYCLHAAVFPIAPLHLQVVLLCSASKVSEFEFVRFYAVDSAAVITEKDEEGKDLMLGNDQVGSIKECLS